MLNYLRKGVSKAGTYIYTSQLRKDLLNSLEHRFKDVEENEAYLFSTYLDPVFGYKAFDKQMKQIVKNKIITVLQVEAIKENAKDQALSESNINGISKCKSTQKRKDNYIFYDDPETISEIDDIERECEEYVRTIKFSTYDNPLEFWKNNRLKFPLLANLAKKY